MAIASFAAPVADFPSWIRAPGRFLPAQRNTGRALFERSGRGCPQRGGIIILSSRFLHAAGRYDLVGALFAPSDTPLISRSTDKLFARVCGVIKDSLSDPDFGPIGAAAEVGISLRCVQKLFTERGTTCSEFIYSLRLDRAAHLLHRRALLRTGQPLTEIAYACGFRDYAHFARKFRHRFVIRRASTPDMVME